MNNTVIYPGTFDPITLGHLDLVKRALHLFDRVIVAVGTGEEKDPLLMLQERIELVRKVFENEPRVEVVTFDGLLVDFAKEKKVKAILRGLRVVSDFDYEFQMASMNRLLAPGIDTIFLTPADQYTYISASLVRTVARCGGAIEKFVPEVVVNVLRKKISV